MLRRFYECLINSSKICFQQECLYIIWTLPYIRSIDRSFLDKCFPFNSFFISKHRTRFLLDLSACNSFFGLPPRVKNTHCRISDGCNSSLNCSNSTKYYLPAKPYFTNCRKGWNPFLELNPLSELFKCSPEQLLSLGKCKKCFLSFSDTNCYCKVSSKNFNDVKIIIYSE